VPTGTIKAWAKQQRDAGGGAPPKYASKEERREWADMREEAARDSFAAAEEALAEVRKFMKAGRPLDAQRAALTMAITVDKSSALAELANQEQLTTVTEQQAQLLAKIVLAWFRDLTGLDFLTENQGKVLRFYTSAAIEHGDVPEAGSAADAQQARHELHEAIRAKLAEQWDAAKEARQPNAPVALLPRGEPVAAEQ